MLSIFLNLISNAYKLPSCETNYFSLTDRLLTLITLTLDVTRSTIIVIVIVLCRLNSFVDFCEDIHFVFYVLVQLVLTFPLFW